MDFNHMPLFTFIKYEEYERQEAIKPMLLGNSLQASACCEAHAELAI